MPPVIRDDPYAAYNFQVIVTNVSDDGVAVSGSFSEVSGLEVSQAPIEYRNGSEDITPAQDPRSEEVHRHHPQARGHRPRRLLELGGGGAQRPGPPHRRLDPAAGREPQRGHALELRPRPGRASTPGPTLNAGNNEIAIETLVICCEQLLIDA